MRHSSLQLIQKKRPSAAKQTAKNFTKELKKKKKKKKK